MAGSIGPRASVSLIRHGAERAAFSGHDDAFYRCPFAALLAGPDLYRKGVVFGSRLTHRPCRAFRIIRLDGKGNSTRGRFALGCGRGGWGPVACLCSVRLCLPARRRWRCGSPAARICRSATMSSRRRTRHGEIAFNVVKIDEAVVDVLAARPRPVFRERFKEYLPAPELTIAAGDTVSVVIWEAAANGLFGNSLPISRCGGDASPVSKQPDSGARRGVARQSDRAARPELAPSPRRAQIDRAPGSRLLRHDADRRSRIARSRPREQQPDQRAGPSCRTDRPPRNFDPRSAGRPRRDDHDPLCRPDRRRRPDRDRAGAPDRGFARPDRDRPAGARHRAARRRQRGNASPARRSKGRAFRSRPAARACST